MCITKHLRTHGRQELHTQTTFHIEIQIVKEHTKYVILWFRKYKYFLQLFHFIASLFHGFPCSTCHLFFFQTEPKDWQLIYNCLFCVNPFIYIFFMKCPPLSIFGNSNFLKSIFLIWEWYFGCIPVTSMNLCLELTYLSMQG